MCANFRDDSVISGTFLTRVEWLRRRGHVYAVVAVARKEIQLAFAAGHELTSKVLICVLADIEREQHRECLVGGGVLLVKNRPNARSNAFHDSSVFPSRRMSAAACSTPTTCVSTGAVNFNCGSR
jgi:hypothetical protein